MIGAFIFLLNALFFGTFYAKFWKQKGGNGNGIICNKDEFYKQALRLVISSIKNDAIFNMYLPKTLEYFRFSGHLIQPLFICSHVAILYRVGINDFKYILFHAEHIIVLSFFVIGTTSHFENISLLFIHFSIVHFTCWVNHKI